MKVKILLFLILLSLVFPSNAHAYLDPGTGSYFIQIIIGGLLGGLFLTKTFWANITKNLVAFLKNFFKRE